MRHTDRVSALIYPDRIRGNLSRIRDRLPAGTKLCAVVKTNGYGHGAVTVARAVEGLANFYAVATVPEALQLREAGITQPILILGYVWPEEYPDMIEHEIRFTVFREEDARRIAETAREMGRTAFVHIKADTGMNRIGFAPDAESAEAVRRIRTFPNVCVEGIFTHFARADETDKTFTFEQLAIFKNFIAMIEKDAERIPIHHCANSAASMELPEAAMDMVRVGISLYGLYPSDEVSREIPLEPAMELTSHVVYVKDVDMGEGISYNHTRILMGDKRVATIPVGYGDGYPRLLSNRGSVLIRGKRAPILGRICMDQFMVDVTEIPGVTEGDLVTLVGRDGENCIPVEELSALSGIFPYEFVCRLGERVPRVVVE